jgi:hypothetical protein
MDNLSQGTKEELQPKKCSVIKKELPDCKYYKYTIPFQSKEEMHKLLPSPIVKWSDYYQTIPDAAREIRNDFYWMNQLRKKSERKERLKNGKEQ